MCVNFRISWNGRFFLPGGKAILPGHFLLDPDAWPLFAGEESDCAGQSEDGPQAGNLDGSAGIEAETDVPVSDADNPRLREEGKKLRRLCSPALSFPVHEMERIMIMKGLSATDGNRTQAAELLGISVRTLRNKLNEYRGMGLEID